MEDDGAFGIENAHIVRLVIVNDPTEALETSRKSFHHSRKPEVSTFKREADTDPRHGRQHMQGLGQGHKPGAA